MKTEKTQKASVKAVAPARARTAALLKSLKVERAELIFRMASQTGDPTLKADLANLQGAIIAIEAEMTNPT